jgi:arylsulfatase A-like enzyme
VNPLPAIHRALVGAAISALLLSLWTCCGKALAGVVDRQRPNVVWILVDDMSPNLSCLGDTSVRTPNLDGLARRGVLFRRAFVTGSICSISRSALVTGCYQTRLGCQNHRSGSAANPIRLPEKSRLIPDLMKSGGYHVSNVGFDDFMRAGGAVGVAKTDYNFEWDRNGLYSTNHWSERGEGRPFFVQVQLPGGKLRGEVPRTNFPARVRGVLGECTPWSAVRLPPWLPADPVLLEDWAQYLDTVRYTDWQVGRILTRLEQAGEAERTVVMFWTDHGISHVRSKQFLYDAGIHVPLIVAGPSLPSGVVRSELVEHIDIGVTTLRLGGLMVPEGMDGRLLPGMGGAGREFVFGARDRADETVDRIRSVRSARYKYIRNFFPNRPYLQPNRYKDDKAVVRAVRRLYTDGALDSVQRLMLAEVRPREEFYELDTDPHEVSNRAGDPALAGELDRHRAALADWIRKTEDQGARVESEPVYLDYVFDGRPEGGRGNLGETFRMNVELMQRWRTEKPMEVWP